MKNPLYKNLKNNKGFHKNEALKKHEIIVSKADNFIVRLKGKTINLKRKCNEIYILFSSNQKNQYRYE